MTIMFLLDCQIVGVSELDPPRTTSSICLTPRIT